MNDLFFNIRVLLKFWQILIRKKFILNKDVLDFERRISQYFGLKHALGVASGTDALVLALKAVNIGPGDEVIVPALGFFSTAGAVTWVNAVPVFVDISLPALNIDDSLIEQAITPRTKAIIISHLNGIVTDISKVAMIAKKHNLVLIEDYAQSLGSSLLGESSVKYGDMVCLSLSANKIFHGCGDGGAILTDNKEIFEKIRLMRMYGTSVAQLGTSHHMPGVASRLPVWNAAILNLRFDSMDAVISKWRKNYFYYLEMLGKSGGNLILPNFVTDKKLIINGYRLIVLTEKREELFNYLQKHDIKVQINYGRTLPSMPAFSYLGYSPGDFPVAERVAREALTLPTDASLNSKDIDRIVSLISLFK